MQRTFLGTAAANAYLEACCRCANCARARALGGPSLRTRSAALMHTALRIDRGPDIHTAAARHGHPLTDVRSCLQTHAHADHRAPSHLHSRARPTESSARRRWNATPRPQRCTASPKRWRAIARRTAALTWPPRRS